MSSSDDEWVQPAKGGVQKRKRASQEGEGNLKGFASAFATIMERPASVLSTVDPKTLAQEPIPEPRKIKEEKKVVGHDSEPNVTDCVRETKFQEMAKRGVVKLFRAVAMHKKHAADQEASRGIGLTKSGQIRRRRPKALPAAQTEEKTKTMSGFLDALKKAKTAVVAAK